MPGTAEGRLIKDCPYTFECFFFRFVDAIASDEVDLHNLPRLSKQISIVAMLIAAEARMYYVCDTSDIMGLPQRPKSFFAFRL